VKGPNQKRVGSGAYGDGKNGHANDSHSNWVQTCTFKTSFTVPGDLSYYKVYVGSGSGISFRLSDLKKNGWNASITGGYDYNPNSNSSGSSYTDGYNLGYDNAYSSSDCDWWASVPAYDNRIQWEAGCRAGYYANPY